MMLVGAVLKLKMHSLDFRVLNIRFRAKGIFTIEIKENIWEQLVRGRFCLVNVVDLKTTKAIGKPKQLEVRMFYPAQTCMYAN